MKLFSWTHILNPDEADFGDRPWVRQTHCCVVLKTKKEFMERFGYSPHTFKDWVHMEKVGERDWDNNGARLAIANPGSVYGQDIWHHTPGEKVYIEIKGR